MKKRYCRYCKKPLKPETYFFCSNECRNAFVEEYVSLQELNEIEKTLRSWTEEVNTATAGKTATMPKCKECKNSCKVRIKKEYLKDNYVFECSEFIKKGKKDGKRN